MFVKRLDRNHYDIFMGNGWSDWTRIRRNHWGVSVVAGKKLPRSIIHELNERFIK